MKECKIINSSDGQPEVLWNADFIMVESFRRTAKILNGYFADGWTVKSVRGDYDPSVQKEGVYSFYKHGNTFYMERAIDDSARETEDEARGKEVERIAEVISTYPCSFDDADNDDDEPFDDEDFDDDVFDEEWRKAFLEANNLLNEPDSSEDSNS